MVISPALQRWESRPSKTRSPVGAVQNGESVLKMTFKGSAINPNSQGGEILQEIRLNRRLGGAKGDLPRYESNRHFSILREEGTIFVIANSPGELG